MNKLTCCVAAAVAGLGGAAAADKHGRWSRAKFKWEMSVFSGEVTMKKYRFALVVLVLGTAIVCGCKTYPVQAVLATPILEISARQTIGRVTLAAMPCRTTAECKAVFNFPMTDKGYTPVLLVIDNRDASTVEVIRSSIELVTPGGDVLAPIDASVVASQFGRNAMVEAIFLFGIFSYADADKYNDAMVRDWQEKGLKEIKIVAPGRTARNYVYFNTGTGAPITGSRLRVPVEWQDTRMSRTFELKY